MRVAIIQPSTAGQAWNIVAVKGLMGPLASTLVTAIVAEALASQRSIPNGGNLLVKQGSHFVSNVINLLLKHGYHFLGSWMRKIAVPATMYVGAITESLVVFVSILKKLRRIRCRELWWWTEKQDVGRREMTHPNGQ